MNNIKSISLIFPVYKDANTVKLMIRKSLRVLKKINKKFEIIIVDDCCPQKSGKIALSISKKIKEIKVSWVAPVPRWWCCPRRCSTTSLAYF